MASGSALPGEFELIARYFAPLSAGFDGAYGLRDDVAVVTPGPGRQIVAKTDAVVAGVHFLADDPPGLIARKALRVNLSDLAAKGAVPLCYMLDLILPPAATEAWIAAFAAGLALDQSAYGIHLVGGDTNATPGCLTIAIAMLGEVAQGRVLRRGGARAGDRIFVTGTIGDAALGLAALSGALPEVDPAAARRLVDRYRLPRPRVTVGPRLIGLATASIDISDGLVADLGHLCEVSGLGAVVEASRVPLSAAARSVIEDGRPWLESVLSGGDDYEILFTAPPDAVRAITRLSRQTRVPIAAIGEMRDPAAGGGPKVRVLDAEGRPIELAHRGWTHFRSRAGGRDAPAP